MLSYINIYFAIKLYKLNKKEQQKVEDKVLQINRLIKNKKIFKKSNFIFLLFISIFIIVLDRLKENKLQYREY